MNADELYAQFFARLSRAFDDDIAQEAIIKTWEASLERKIFNPEAYLFRTAKRLQINQWRLRGDRVMVNLDDAPVPSVAPTQVIRAELREVTERFPDVVVAEVQRGGRGYPRKNSTLDVHQNRARRRARACSS